MARYVKNKSTGVVFVHTEVLGSMDGMMEISEDTAKACGFPVEKGIRVNTGKPTANTSLGVKVEASSRDEGMDYKKVKRG